MLPPFPYTPRELLSCFEASPGTRTHSYTWARTRTLAQTHILRMHKNLRIFRNFATSLLFTFFFPPAGNHSGTFKISPTLRKIGNKETRMSHHTYNTMDMWEEIKCLYGCEKKKKKKTSSVIQQQRARQGIGFSSACSSAVFHCVIRAHIPLHEYILPARS